MLQATNAIRRLYEKDTCTQLESRYFVWLSIRNQAFILIMIPFQQPI